MTEESTHARPPSRRKKKRPEIDHSVPSPCVKVCQFSGNDFCDGCYRNIDEIREWIIMSREQKLLTLDNISSRKQQLKKGDR
ncbi:MAG: putative Fe-S protein YdhL (DUF1289 family) [Gammaproteobacteria bacterium]|jgi:predicted Fe-S protein YdhL (DUF1289 family)